MHQEWCNDGRMDGAGLHSLSRAIRRLAILTTSDPAEEVGPAEVLVGTDLFTHPATTVSEIVQRTGMAQSQVSAIVAQMRDAGMIVARRDPADRRRTLLEVTAEAREQYGSRRGRRDPRDAIRAHLESAGKHAGETEVDAVLAALERLEDLLQP